MARWYFFEHIVKKVTVFNQFKLQIVIRPNGLLDLMTKGWQSLAQHNIFLTLIHGSKFFDLL